MSLGHGVREELTVDFALEVASNTTDVLLDDGCLYNVRDRTNSII